MSKVAFISNQNNFNFSIVRLLRDRGVDAYLLLMTYENEEYIYHPSKDTNDESYKDFTIQLNWGGLNDDFAIKSKRNKLKTQVKNDLQEFTFIMGGFTAPAYLALAGIKNDLYLPMGADTRVIPSYYRKGKYGTTKEHNYRAYYQRKGIRATKYIVTGINAHQEVMALKPKGIVLNYPIPALYSAQYNPEKRPDVSKLKEGEYDFTIISHNRHAWHVYGNDVLINALKQVVEKSNVRPRLLMFKAGWQVDKSEELVKQLELEEFVQWIPEVSRSEVMEYLQLSDLVAIEFVPQAIIQSGTIFESLYFKKPIIMSQDVDAVKKICKNPPPIKVANTANQLAEAIIAFKTDPISFSNIAENGKKWYHNIVEGETIDTIIQLIDGQPIQKTSI